LESLEGKKLNDLERYNIVNASFLVSRKKKKTYQIGKVRMVLESSIV
jgi:hypothetical protein